MVYRNNANERDVHGYYVYYPAHEPHPNWRNQEYSHPGTQGHEENQAKSNSFGEETLQADEIQFMQQFLNENGQLDIQKTLSMVNQFADTVHQVSPVIKELNEVIKGFRK